LAIRRQICAATGLVRLCDRGGKVSQFSKYRRKQIAELRPYEPGESLDRVSVSAADREAGSPKAGDMIARNPRDHGDMWLVAAEYFSDNFEPIEDEYGHDRRRRRRPAA
jgi:hypothetical protein